MAKVEARSVVTTPTKAVDEDGYVDIDDLRQQRGRPAELGWWERVLVWATPAIFRVGNIVERLAKVVRRRK